MAEQQQGLLQKPQRRASSDSSTEKKVKLTTDQGGWHGYGLDQKAQELVLDARMRDPDSLNQAHKMRQTVAYGLERFWGEPFRLQPSPEAIAKAEKSKKPKKLEKLKAEENKALFWTQTWDALVEIMAEAGIDLPNDKPNVAKPNEIKMMAKKLWGLAAIDNQGTKLENSDRQVALAVLTQLCDCIVWWKQRYQ